jgi:hypothetical protein
MRAEPCLRGDVEHPDGAGKRRGEGDQPSALPRIAPLTDWPTILGGRSVWVATGEAVRSFDRRIGLIVTYS